MKNIKTFFYEYFGLSKWRILPWVVYVLLIPCLIIHIRIKYGIGLIYGSLVSYILFFFYPLFSTLWTILYLNEVLTLPGKELFQFYRGNHKSSVCKIQLPALLILFFTTALAALGWKSLWLDGLGAALVCIFLNAGCYLLLRTFPFPILAASVTVLYPIFVFFLNNGGHNWFIYYNKQPWTTENLFYNGIPLILATVTMYFIGSR